MGNDFLTKKANSGGIQNLAARSAYASPRKADPLPKIKGQKKSKIWTDGIPKSGQLRAAPQVCEFRAFREPRLDLEWGAP